MNLLAFSITCFFNITAAVASLYFLHLWLSDAGIDFFAGQIFAYPVLISVIFSLLTVLAVIAVLFYAPKFLPPIYMIGLIGATGCVFLGIRLILQPDTFFVGYAKKWHYYINTAKTGYIQERFGCCGYNRPREFSDDNCNISFTQPCLKRIISEYAQSIQIGGLQIILHGISFGLLLYFAIMAPCPSVILLPPVDQGTPIYMNPVDSPNEQMMLDQTQGQIYSVQQNQVPQMEEYLQMNQNSMVQNY